MVYIMLTLLALMLSSCTMSYQKITRASENEEKKKIEEHEKEKNLVNEFLKGRLQ